MSYKRQMEVYQWLLRQNGFSVARVGYFVYANGQTDRAAFDGKLEFIVKLLPYEGDDSWVEGALLDIRKCLSHETLPAAGVECDWCPYRAAAFEFEIGGAVR